MDEMEALSETIHILCSDEMRSTFGVAIKSSFKTRSDIVSFLQTSESYRRALDTLRKTRALDTLRKTTRSAHSLWLVSIAARMQEI